MTAKDLLKKILPHAILRSYRLRKYGRFNYLKCETGGLLDVEVYERLSDVLQTAEDLDIVEVGGAAGTASICIAWAMRAARMKSSLIVIEKCEGGTRDQYGDYQSNLERYRRFTRDFGAAKRIKLYPHYLTFDNAAEVLALVRTERIGAFVLDADGHIHRDFHIFWPRLVDLGHIVVDDYHPNLTPKHALTYRLLNRIIDWGLFEPIELLNGTYFGRKPRGGRFEKLDLDEANRIVTEVCEKYRVKFDKSGLHAL